MTEERITETQTPAGDTHTTHTVITDERRSGGSIWIVVLILIVLGVVGLYIYSQQSGAEAARDNAIANAANQVGDAAGQIGDAAQDAGEAVSDAAKKN